MPELKTPDQLIAEALVARKITQSAEATRTKKQELRAIKAVERYRKAQLKKLPPFWWAGAFRSKLELAHDLAALQNSLNDYQDHCRNQSVALTQLYRWALAHDPGDDSLDAIKKMLGPIKTPTFDGGKL